MYKFPSFLSINFFACISRAAPIRSAIDKPEKNPENISVTNEKHLFNRLIKESFSTNSYLPEKNVIRCFCFFCFGLRNFMPFLRLEFAKW